MDSSQTNKTSLRDFLHVIFKRKFLILIFFLVTICTVALVTLTTKPSYLAAAKILVKIGRENLYTPATKNTNPVIYYNREEQINSKIEILKGRSLVEKIVDNLGAKNIYRRLSTKDQSSALKLSSNHQHKSSSRDRAILCLQNNLKIEAVGESNIIKVSYKHEDPVMAARVVNNLASIFLDKHLTIYKDHLSYKFFQDQSRQLKVQLDQAEAKLMLFKKQHDINSLNEERQLLLMKESDLGAALNQTFSEEAETKTRIHNLVKQIAGTPKKILQVEEIDHNPPIITNLRQMLVDLELKRKELLNKYTPESRLVLNLDNEIQVIQSQLDEQETKLHGKSHYEINRVFQRLEDDLLKNQLDLKAMATKMKTQRVQFEDYRQKLKDLNQIEVDLNRFQQEVDLNRKNYQLYLTKFEESRISSAMTRERITNVSLIEPASPPIKPVSPKVALNLILAAFIGIFGALAMAFLAEYLSDGLEKPDDIEEALQLPILSSIPEFKNIKNDMGL